MVNEDQIGNLTASHEDLVTMLALFYDESSVPYSLINSIKSTVVLPSLVSSLVHTRQQLKSQAYMLSH